MRRLIRPLGAIVACAIFACMLSAVEEPASAEEPDFYAAVGFDRDENYLELMISAAEDGSEHAMLAGQLYEEARNLKIKWLKLDVGETDFFTYYSTGEGVLKAIQRYIDQGNKMSPYQLSDSERKIVEGAVYAEAGGESYLGQLALAQAILDGMLRKNLDAASSIKAHQIVVASSSSDSCRQAVYDVFDRGVRVTDEPMDHWYSKSTYSAWHEAQHFVIEIGNHRFFYMND